MLVTVGGFTALETLALILSILKPIWGAAFGLGVLYTRLNHQREELTRIRDNELVKVKESINDLKVKLEAYLLATEELKQSGGDKQPK